MQIFYDINFFLKVIQQRSVLKVADNSGAKLVRCIKVLGGFNKRFACLGDLIVVSVIELRNKSKKTSKVIKGDVFRALVNKSKKSSKRKDGVNFFFDDNSCILINKQGNPVGTRVIGPIPKTLRKKKNLKFVSLCTGVV